MQDHGYTKESLAVSEKMNRYLTGITGLTAGDTGQYPLLILQGRLLLGEFSHLREKIRESAEQLPETALTAMQTEAALKLQEEQLQDVIGVLEQADRTKTEADHQLMDHMIGQIKERFTNG